MSNVTIYSESCLSVYAWHQMTFLASTNAVNMYELFVEFVSQTGHASNHLDLQRGKRLDFREYQKLSHLNFY